ncbi:MAG: hypothetical protein IPK69_10790 [Phycisphaerales bacterium]|nr:MAG: hypothetical protein IPK69_10790 [Phycisphaerales bacterium]
MASNRLRLAAGLAFAFVPFAAAQPTIDWYTIDGGGGTSSGGLFTLSGTIGQPDAGAPMSGGSFTIVGGFWAAGSPIPACVADFDDGSGTGTPDSAVTIDDLLYYLTLFQSGSIAADVDDGSGTNTQDSAVTIDDLLYFLQRFQDGC